MYPYSSLPPVPSTRGSPCSLEPCPASAGGACGGWEAEAGRMALLVGVGIEVEERAGSASGGPGTGAGFSGLRDTLSVFNSCMYRVMIEELSVKASTIASCEHWGQWTPYIPPSGWWGLSQLGLCWERQTDIFKQVPQWKDYTCCLHLPKCQRSRRSCRLFMRFYCKFTNTNHLLESSFDRIKS